MEEQIREALRKILDVADLSVVTERALRKQLAESLDADMTPWHDLIKVIIMVRWACVSSLQSVAFPALFLLGEVFG